MLKLIFLGLCTTLLSLSSSLAQHSVARQWNEALLGAIRNDFARPTIHARNLFHTAVVMYDAWAVYDETADTYLLNRNLGPIQFQFNGINTPSDVELARNETISYAAFGLLKHRFENSPNAYETLKSFDSLMNYLGYDKDFVSIDYSNGSSAALGNFLAQSMIEFGLLDYSNESKDYRNSYYKPINDLLPINRPSKSISLRDPNRWQPLGLETFIGQSGISQVSFPDFLSPEWGIVSPFSLSTKDLNVNKRNNVEYWVYKDPGAPPYIDLKGEGATEALFKWNFRLVLNWSGHLDPNDGVMWDISPGAIGNLNSYPNKMEDYDKFYDELNGGDPSKGHDENPHTNQPYMQQIVPRGDYTRVLAEFWADGPDSETPPGHWFTILNYVSDHSLLEKKIEGQGEILNNLEWDIKSYFALGGAMHDAAIAAWGIKGWYDYIRPISAIRYLASKGQSSKPNQLSYHEDGMTLLDGNMKVITGGDSLAWGNQSLRGKIKAKAWLGPEYIKDPKTDQAGVDWVVVERWWPYQRPTFVTPPFAGYISGHSTYSRAAAEVLTMLTDDPFFPGGMGEFIAPKNEFLVFEEGPSVDVTLQWATYRDASDQCSLSRIWGGIHPPADDIPGRLIGKEIGIEAFNYAKLFFTGDSERNVNNNSSKSTFIFPNPILEDKRLTVKLLKPTLIMSIEIIDLQGKIHYTQNPIINNNEFLVSLNLESLTQGIYIMKISTAAESHVHKFIIK